MKPSVLPATPILDVEDSKALLARIFSVKPTSERLRYLDQLAKEAEEAFERPLPQHIKLS